MTKKSNLKKSDAKFVFFGTEPLAEEILNELASAGYVPSLVVAAPDVFDRRTKTLAPPIEKRWALARNIPVAQPENITSGFISELKRSVWDFFIVASYGKILPSELVEIPRRGVLNVHPSLLPRLRGPSPIRSAILGDERATGVSIMLMDQKMDHGPIVAQKKAVIDPNKWPLSASALGRLLAREGGNLIVQILPAWLGGDIEAREQNHDIATFTDKIDKEDGLLNLNDDPYSNLLKVRAYEGWPGTYSFFERDGKRIRVSIIDAHVENGAFVIDTVKPEGKRAMPYKEFLKSGARPLAR